MLADRYNKKNAGTWKVVEFFVHWIDEFGDSMKSEPFETREDAESLAYAAIYSGETERPEGTAATIVERSEKTYPLYRGVPDKFRTLSTYGSRDAAVAGGWVAEIQRPGQP